MGAALWTVSEVLAVCPFESASPSAGWKIDLREAPRRAQRWGKHRSREKGERNEWGPSESMTDRMA
jgi:hypothetical protein